MWCLEWTVPRKLRLIRFRIAEFAFLTNDGHQSIEVEEVRGCMRPHEGGPHPRVMPAPYDWPVEGDITDSFQKCFFPSNVWSKLSTHHRYDPYILPDEDVQRMRAVLRWRQVLRKNSHVCLVFKFSFAPLRTYEKGIEYRMWQRHIGYRCIMMG